MLSRSHKLKYGKPPLIAHDGGNRNRAQGSKSDRRMWRALDSTYGVWLVSLFIETMLFGAGALQAWIYCFSWNNDTAYIKSTVGVVVVLEIIQVIFFFKSSYSRFVDLFGIPQGEVIWEDSLQLLSAYLSAFCVQLFFASRVHKLTRGRKPFSLAAIGMYFIGLFAFLQVGAGIAQVIVSHQVRFYANLDSTKAITTLQGAASLACDLLITVYLCIFLKHQKTGVSKTNYMIDRLFYDAINRGTLTSLASAATIILFLAVPDTFWFFLGLAPSSKLYMNSMLATLNTRSRLRDQMTSQDKGWNSISMDTVGSSARKRLQVQVTVDHDSDAQFHKKSQDLGNFNPSEVTAV